MRAVPITVTALAAALLLTACGGGGDDTAGDGESKASGSSAAPADCAAGDLGLAVGAVNAAPAAGDTGNVTVTVTNNGGTCTLKGFPKVALAAEDGSEVTVPRDPAAQAQPLPLAEQGTAAFTITYVRAADGADSGLAATTLTYGLPDAAETESATWSYGAVALKDAKTPDATVSGFQATGD
ncbi:MULTISPECIES: DUF4232 domain-containing protein [unclassified Streptomyces]|uniref:DUF4232 domain-containing protein n=1 Tax=unclassified Streptomyces TaxID=2593676 RepID=UPI0038252D0F